mgnify:CR=1 FL=1
MEIKLPPRGTVIFDFDSTLIKFESLDDILAEKLSDAPEKAKAIAEITEKGMNGDLSFFDSLSQRMKIATPEQKDLAKFATDHCPQAFSSGIPELIQVLHDNNIEVWVLSGGFEEAILPFAEYLNIPRERVHAVQVHWYQDGGFKSLNKDNNFAISKIAGASELKPQWHAPTIIVGDGYTDYMLYKEKLADHFIAYTEHFAREKVINSAEYTADSAQALSIKLKELLAL